MSTVTVRTPAVPLDEEIKSRFESMLPELNSRIRACIFNLPDREEAGAEMMAHTWVNFRQAARNDRWLSAGQIVWVAWQAVRSGRTQHSSVRDIHSPLCQKRGGFSVAHLSHYRPQAQRQSPPGGRRFASVLASDRNNPADEAAVRIDWHVLHERLPRRMQEVLRGIVMGESGKNLAKRLRLSAARITQLKDELAVRIAEYFGPDLVM